MLLSKFDLKSSNIFLKKLLNIPLYFPLFLCSYDEEADKVNQYQRLNLEGLEKIEIGKTFELVSRSKGSC